MTNIDDIDRRRRRLRLTIDALLAAVPEAQRIGRWTYWSWTRHPERARAVVIEAMSAVLDAESARLRDELDRGAA